MSSPHLGRGLLLFEQARYDLAENEFKQALTQEPDDAYAHAMLSMCLANREALTDATTEAKRAIELAPDMPFAHYALARVLHERNHIPEAHRAIDEAIRLDPEDPDFHALKSGVFITQRNWASALSFAEQGLQGDAEHVGCTNLRALALTKLGRREEAGQTIGAALARNPEDALTHANQGWAYLEKGNHARALEHFREALRLEPGNEWARQGIVEALKARNIVYGVMLRYFLWMGRLSPRVQWVIVLGGYFGARALQGVARNNPSLAPFIWPIIVVYVAFALMTWIADPLFNLVLRTSRFGRLALSREQIVHSNWIGAAVFLALAPLLWWVLTQRKDGLVIAFIFGLLIIPLAGTLGCNKGWPRNMMALFTIVMAGAGIGALVIDVLGLPGEKQVVRPMLSLFFFAAILSPWVANALRMARPRR